MCNLCALAFGLALHIFATVLMSPNKKGTAVHCYDLALSVIVMLVSRNIFQVVSALQSIVFIHFLAEQISCRSNVGSV